MTALGDDGLVTFKSSGGQAGAVNPGMLVPSTSP